MKQVTWQVKTPDGPVTGYLNSPAPLTYSEWLQRIQEAIADALPPGEYALELDMGVVAQHKMTAVVYKKCDIVPF